MNQVKIKVTKDGKLKKTIEIETPQNWEECEAKQTVEMVNTIAFTPDEYQCKIELLALALKGKNKSYLLGLDDGVILSMFPLIDWCFTEKLTTPVLSDFRHQFGRYYLPKKKLENISCLEWWKADSFFTNYQSKKDVKDIDLLIATLCRQKNANQQEAIGRDDVREVLVSQMQIEQNADRLRKLDPKIKIYVLYFFSGCKEWVHSTYKRYLFPDDDIPGETPQPQDDGNPFGWYGIFQQVAESGVFGDLQNILINVKFIDLCAYLVSKKIEQEKMEKKRQQLNSKTHE